MKARSAFTSLTGGIAGLATRVAGGAKTARAAEWSAARLRYAAGVLDGVAYRAHGRHPDPAVTNAVLADRVRSELGPVLKQLDLPRLNVMVEEHVVLLHGEISSVDDALAIMAAVREVPGVADVRSYLHVGLDSGATRPSEGRGAPSPSTTLTGLRTAVRHAGVVPLQADRAAAAVVRALLDRLPEGEREHVRLHLPTDVLEMVDAAKVPRTSDIRTRQEFLAAITVAVPGLARDTALDAAVAIFAELQRRVPEERRDVAAVLPQDLKDLWERPQAADRER